MPYILCPCGKRVQVESLTQKEANEKCSKKCKDKSLLQRRNPFEKDFKELYD